MKPTPFDSYLHYALICKWWMDRGREPIPLEFLPRVGVVMETDAGKPVCAGFLYYSDSACAQISHLVADKDVDVAIRSPMLDRLIGILEKTAKSRGFSFVAGASNLPHLVKRYERLGFIKSDEHVTVLGKGI